MADKKSKRRKSVDISRGELIGMIGSLRGLVYDLPASPERERILNGSTFDVDDADEPIVKIPHD